MTRRVLLYPGEDGFIVAEVPSLPGCISQGRTRDEALANVREAIHLHVEVLVRKSPPAQTTIPNHKELHRGTLRAIIRQTGLTVEEFVALL